ncbi:GSCOCG00011487001-RA-CDS [Cotesia congregata]|uniref:Small ribosomal subunit protein bS6m n=1 Tax=Cotesia congregata TaxID=51543 RepID=A0A8J2HFG3_COTCN|nr:GSCOCG00011487001-RA-CDS [Cotesia congregata]CAG5093066.1 Similar to mRpS6: Probable 28S ribosomal protein S6 [Cotesia congregata]
MPTYEMPLLLRIMSKPETFNTLKRVSTAIFSKKGIIRKIDNLGQKPTPYKMSNHNMVHREANYYVIHFDVPPRKIDDLLEEYGRDIDIIRSRIYKKPDDKEQPQCTWHEEMLPPPYRPEVQKLMDIAAKSKTGYTIEFKYNSGLDYNPFQR